MTNLKHSKKEAWQYYRTWMKEKTYSTILKREVRITRKGWDHIITGSKRKRRTVADMNRRLNLLKLAKVAIKRANILEKSYRNNVGYTILIYRPELLLFFCNRKIADCLRLGNK